MAFQCGVREGYHVQSEHLIVEVVDEAGRPCLPGTVGRVIVTDLHNFATPLIRYEIGDVAEPGPPCPCGRQLPVLSRVLGRARNMLRLPGGHQRWPSLPSGDVLGRMAPVRQFQLAQTGPAELVLRLVVARLLTADEEATVLYTGDMKALASDEIYVRFITGRQDAFVIEDADHLLKPRADGNEHLHRFLTIADGVVRSQGRKIIFSTNLPNVGDLDDALIRPGRCFARVHVRNLNAAEAGALARELGSDAYAPEEGRRHSLAEIYQRVR